MSYALRTFQKNDADSVKELILKILAKEYPFDRSAYSDSDLDRIGEVYGGSRDSFFLIEGPEGVVGTVGIKEESKEEALLRRLFVDSRHRKKGHGTSLLEKALDFCRSKGYHKVRFRCTDRMADAMHLCIKKGFKEVESLKVGGFKIHVLELAI